MDWLIWKMKQLIIPKTWGSMRGKIAQSLESFRDQIIDGTLCIPSLIILPTIEITARKYLVRIFHLQIQLNLTHTTVDLKWLGPKSTSRLLTRTHGSSLILDIFTTKRPNLDLRRSILPVQIVATVKIYTLRPNLIPKPSKMLGKTFLKLLQVGLMCPTLPQRKGYRVIFER